MGRVNRFICPSCKMTWQIQLGHGFCHARLENVLDAFPAAFPSFEFQYKAAVCPKCRQVLSVPVIHLHQSGNTYAPACPDCGISVQIKEEEETLICPVCGESPLFSEDAGRWD